MTKRLFVTLLMMLAVAVSVHAQGLPRRSLGSRTQRQMDSVALLESTTNEAERAQIEQRIKNGEIPEPLLPIEEALALAEKGDGKGYYQLAVRYAKGEGVECNQAIAAQFLKKAYDVSYPRAVFAVAIALEWGLNAHLDKVDFPDDVRNRMMERLGACFQGGFYAVEIGIAKDLSPFGYQGIYGSITNQTFVARVRREYEHAYQLGMTVAQAELAKLEERIAKVDVELAVEAVRLKNSRAAQMLLGKTGNERGLKKAEESKPNQDEHVAHKGELEECVLWSSWPTRISDEEQMDIRAQAERKFNCVLMLGDRASTNAWRVGRGASCILSQDSQYGWDVLQKIDASGKIIGISRSDATDYETFEELKWLNDQENGRIAEHQEKWAREHNMTIDEAKAKYAKWKDEHPVGLRPLGGLRRPGMLGGGLLGGGSLRARRLQRQQEAAAAAAKQREEQSAKEPERQAQAELERQQREAERAEQRQQLLAIQEELKRVRGVKAAAEKEAR